ncbi:DoxX family protein [Marinicellulosiphila megalodicopiae]|uniref:DoxX family protein n=1 Tax=Marinicellulosiphila megalodicopiae TaxID=2724896 RepID=UPI003BAF0C4E
MNIVLWVLQAILAFLCLSGGAYKVFQFQELQKSVISMQKLPSTFWVSIGLFECVAAIFLIIPMLIGFLPILTPVSALAMLIESIIITVIYIKHRDFPPISFTIFMLVLAAIIAFFRF